MLFRMYSANFGCFALTLVASSNMRQKLSKAAVKYRQSIPITTSYLWGLGNSCNSIAGSCIALHWFSGPKYWGQGFLLLHSLMKFGYTQASVWSHQFADLNGNGRDVVLIGEGSLFCFFFQKIIHFPMPGQWWSFERALREVHQVFQLHFAEIRRDLCFVTWILVDLRCWGSKSWKWHQRWILAKKLQVVLHITRCCGGRVLKMYIGMCTCHVCGDWRGDCISFSWKKVTAFFFRSSHNLARR